jgi:glycosyltransferase involved in cell wall biosynthesis
MKERKPRMAGVLVGDIYKDPGARIKYGAFFDVLAERLPLVEVYDATLSGWSRYWNALLTFSPNSDRWRERFYKNVPAFRLRSLQAHKHFQRCAAHIDLLVQVGVLLNARWQESALPSVIYTDYTAHLAAQFPAAGRSPFSPPQRQAWMALEREALVQASHICTRSALVRDSIIYDYGIAPERVTVIGGGINFAQLPAPVEHREKARPTALFIGKELYRKGGDVLLLAFAQARKVVPGARLLLLTSGPVSYTHLTLPTKA